MLLTARQVCKEFFGGNVSPQRLYAAAREGLIPSVRLGRRIFFDEEALRAWAAKGGQSFPGGWKRE